VEPAGIRVTQQPGGNSSLSLRWEEKPAPKRDPPKPRNIMQCKSQEVVRRPERPPVNYKKLVESAGSPKKLSVRVLSPPGGRSSFNLGW
jgi:hypothetical protein